MEAKMQGSAGSAGFKLVGFPKEFERSFWDYFDKRYYTILIITWIVLYGLAFYFSTREWHLSEEEVQKIKEQVIKKVYGAEIMIEQEPVAEEGEGEGGFAAVPEEEPQKEIGEEGKKIVEESATDRVQRRARARASRAERTRQLQQEVASAGILGIVTAGGGGGTGNVEFADVLKDIKGGAGGIRDVGEVVQGTAGIAIASSGTQRTRLVKGGGQREAGGGIGIDELIEGEAVAGAVEIKRRGEIKLAADLSVTGTGAKAASRDQQSIMSVINLNKTSVEYCYQKRLKVNPSLSGEISLEIEISPDGRVTNVRILRSTLGDKQLEDCIVRAVRRWRGFGSIDPSFGNVKAHFKYIF